MIGMWITGAMVAVQVAYLIGTKGQNPIIWGLAVMTLISFLFCVLIWWKYE